MSKVNINVALVLIMLGLFFATGCQGSDVSINPNAPAQKECTPEEERAIRAVFDEQLKKATNSETISVDTLTADQVKEILAPIAPKLIADTVTIMNKKGKKVFTSGNVQGMFPPVVSKGLISQTQKIGSEAENMLGDKQKISEQ